MFIIRNDDIHKVDDKLKKFHKIVDDYDIQVIHGVIPAKASKDLSQFLKGRAKPAQHGYKHENHGSQSNKFEFGNGRGYQEQLEEISQGKQKMNEIFNDWLKCFIPPYHAFNQDTIKAVENLNFKYFSASAHNDYRTSLERIDANLRFPPKNKKRFLLKIAKKDDITLLTHHQKLDQKSLKLLDKCIKKHQQ